MSWGGRQGRYKEVTWGQNAVQGVSGERGEEILSGTCSKGLGNCGEASVAGAEVGS